MVDTAPTKQLILVSEVELFVLITYGKFRKAAQLIVLFPFKLARRCIIS